MIIAAIPADEDLRLQDLFSYNILDTAHETDFEELVELAGEICNSPVSLITLLDKDRLWFKAKKGINEDSISRDVAFCSHAILQNGVFMVEDATKDERFVNNPLVTGSDGIRFYAGAPVISPTGYKLGTVSIIGREAKTLSENEKKALLLISKQVTKLLELRKKNMIIRQRAEEIINLKTKTITNVMKEQEDDKKQIAFTLHEDLAQRLASSMIYLDIAQHNEAQRADMIRTAKAEIKNVLIEMRKLSYSITPYTAAWIAAEELVAEFVEKVADSFDFDIMVSIEKSIQQASQDNALTAIRILEQWFKILSDKRAVSRVFVSVKTGDFFELLVTDNGEENTDEFLKEKIRDSRIYDRVHSQNGVIEIITAGPEKNILDIRLPVNQKLA